MIRILPDSSGVSVSVNIIVRNRPRNRFSVLYDVIFCPKFNFVLTFSLLQIRKAAWIILSPGELLACRMFGGAEIISLPRSLKEANDGAVG